jgi:CubicO group peptidase (beta-lactamase class C family)
MNRSDLRIIIILILFLAGLSCKQQVTEEKPPQNFTNPSNGVKSFHSGRLALIDSVLIHYIDSGLLPNAVTFVAHKGQIVHNKAFGYKNIEAGIPLEKDDIFRIASQTKAITTVALMTLYEQGKFLLDDPVSAYLPEFGNLRVLTGFNDADTTYTSRPAERDITIRHLLNHTSGIHYGILGGPPGNKMFAKEGIPAVNSMDPVTIKEIAGKISKMPLLFDPGDRYMYGMNTDIAGYLIEVLSGQTLDVFFKNRIFEPLGMKNTYFYIPSEKEERLVQLYTRINNELVLHPNETYRNYPVAGARQFLSGGAGLCGTIEDYARFCQMLLNKGEFNGNRILSRKTIELMTHNQIGDLEYGNYDRRFGLGFDIWGEGTPAHHLGSRGSFRWGGMYYSDYMIDPAEDLILIFYTNIQPWRGPNLQEIFHNLVYQALE